MEVTLASAQTVTSAVPQKVLEDAVDEFDSILTSSQRDKLRHIGAVRDAETVMIFTAQLDRENQLHKGRGVASRLISVLQSVHAFSTVVETFVSSNPKIAALVWGSIKFAMLIAVNYTSYFEALSRLFMSFSNHCPRFAKYQALYPASTRLQKALCDFHASIIRCCKHIVEATQRPWQKQLANAFWQSFDQEFKPYVNEIQNLAKEVTKEIELAKVIIQSQEQKLQEIERAAASKQRSRFRKFIPTVEKELNGIKELQLRQSTRQSREERLRLLEFLSSQDYITPFKEACRKRQCDTAEWILKTPEFKRWYNGTGSSLLWFSGKIGSGKTILCANVINHVLANKGCNVRVAFFFLQYDKSDSLKAETTIRSIIRQSIDTTALPRHIEHRLKDLSQKLFIELQDWVDLARQGIECSNTFYIFIDGLDESDAAERRALLDALSSLASTAHDLRIFIASRDSVHLDLRGRFSDMEHVSMSSDSLTLDIRLYIEATIQERTRNRDLMIGDPRLLDNIKQTLSEYADGMFLWVTFLISEVCTASCDSDIRYLLHNLPRDLEETFSRALSRIITRQRMPDLAQKIFRWVAAAKRPLSLGELREAVSIEIGQEYLRPDRRVREMDPIVLWCENLIQVTEGALLVQFAHSTVRDFMVRANLPTQLIGFHIDLEEVDHFMGEICITYLHLNDFKTTIARRPRPFRFDPMGVAGTALSQGSKAGLVKRLTHFASKHGKTRKPLDMTEALTSYSRADTDRSWDNLLEEHPFLKYAARHWISHTSDFQERKSSTWSLWQHIITDGHSLADIPWQNSLSQENEHAILIWSHQTHHYALLHYSIEVLKLSESTTDDLIRQSAFKGDIKAIAIFLEAGNYSSDGLNRSLQAASEGGYLQVVERLLAAGADVNAAAAADYDGRTALQAASEGGHLQVVERLLAAGADVNAAAAGRRGRTALQAASQGGHIQVVERLLAAANYGGRTALQAASEGGHLQVMERLLAAGADVNAAAADYGGRTALQAASQGGYLQVVERLLAAGADVNAAAAADYDGRTALQAASEGGHLQVVERLLAAGADVNAAAAADYGGRTALQAASEGGHLQVVERLLAAGADVNAASDYGGRTALQAASEGGHLQVMERLLAAGADVNAAAADYDGRTALQAASEGGHLQVVERLLAAGADVNAAAADYDGRTALQAASQGGHLQVVERLLAAGADVNAASDYGGRTALQAASQGGYLQVMERLLAAGADVNAAAGRRGRTALQAASQGGHLQVVERLLAAGRRGRTALQAASQGGYLQVVERLLAAGADVNAAAGRRGRTALQAASQGGHFQVVERLLAAANYGGRTALQAASQGGYLQVVERLLAAGADVNAAAAADYDGRTALQAASQGGHLQVVERLLAAGADVNAAAADYGGRTALQAASQGGYLQVVERLLAAGADVNAAAAADYDGRTALQAASEGGYLQVVERLLAAGADVNAAAADYDGRTALQAASQGGHFQVVDRLLATANYGGRTALQAASEGGHLQVVERLLAAGADVNATADYGRGTALQAASQGGHLQVVERLLAAGADVNATADYGRGTALQAASQGGHLQVVERLLAAGARKV